MPEIATTCLMIDSRRLESIALDGPALKVCMRTQSARLFPLRRLSRIHIVGPIKVGLDSLLYCAEKQVPVAFFTTAGKLRCQLYFPVFENSIISHWLEHVDFDVEVKTIYDEWLLHQTLHMISLIGYKQGARESRYKLVREKLHCLCKRRLGKAGFHSAMDWLNGMLTAQVSQLIVDHGLSNQGRGKQRLLEDIGPLCELLLLYALACQLVRRKLRISAQSMSDLYQDSAEKIEYNVRRMLTQLATRLESIV